MKITIKKFGVIGKAEFTLADLTIICGENNTGKTYAAYALYGFLDLWKRFLLIKVSEKNIKNLLNEGSIQLNLQNYIDDAKSIIEKGCKRYSEHLWRDLAASENLFADSKFSVDLEIDKIQPMPEYASNMGSANTGLFSITKHADSMLATISLLIGKNRINIPKSTLKEVIGGAMQEIVFSHCFPKPFIASGERTGAAIFRNELNFARARLLEEIAPSELLSRVYAGYAFPVKSNVEFSRQLEEVAKQESFISTLHPEIIHDFADIVGGEYVVKRDVLYFVPKKKKQKILTMDESSSAVRSLSNIGFYLRYKATRGDLLIVDEPELTLHPENQRRVARLFAKLTNVGIKILMTTHSDYIIKELNTLIMLKQTDERLKNLAEREGYISSELLDPARVRVYIAEEGLVSMDGGKRRTRSIVFEQADIDETSGIEARSFDSTIQNMNRIQDEIVWGGCWND